MTKESWTNLLDSPLVDTTALVDHVTGGGRLTLWTRWAKARYVSRGMKNEQDMERDERSRRVR